jgi:hypothetical protein
MLENDYLFLGLLVKILGYQKIAVLALVLYSVRLSGFTVLTSPELFLILEILKPFSTTLLIMAAMNFVKSNSPLTSISTAQSIFSSAHFGVGKNRSF